MKKHDEKCKLDASGSGERPLVCSYDENLGSIIGSDNI
jgi:hypothetical protein